MKIFTFFEIVYDPVFIVQLLAISLSLIIVFYPLKSGWRSILVMLGHLVGLFAVGTVLNWQLFWLSGTWHWLNGICFQIAWFITIFVYLSLFSKIYLPSRIVMGATLFITVITTTNLGREIMKVISFLSVADLGNYLSYALIIVFSVILRKFTLRNYSDIPLVSVILVMINVIVSISLVFHNIIASMSTFFKPNPSYCLLLISLYVFAVTNYLMVYFHCKANKEKLLAEIQNRLLKSDKQVLEISEKALEEMRTVRHDFKNQLQVMGLMLQNEQYEELRAYFSSMSEEFMQDRSGAFITCGNRLVDSIINMEILKAESYGIRLLTKVLVSSEINIDPSDLCRVIVNLVDNAMEGVLRTDSNDYIVDCKIGTHADYLYICVQNAVSKDLDKDQLLKMNTVKTDSTRHGFGHRIVKRIVEKYNGSIDYKIEENIFIAQAMLDFTMLKRGGENGTNA